MRTATVKVTALVAILCVPALVAQDAAALIQELRGSVAKDFPTTIHVTAAGSGYKAGDGTAQVHYRIEPHTEQIEIASPNRMAAWTTPLGFLAAASSQQPTLTTETLLGTAYRVIGVTTAAGQQVRGYVTDKNVLERTRTELQDGAGRKVQAEAVFMDWRDFDGIRFPSLIIHKENDRVARILVVTGITKDTKGAKDTKESKS